jgi:hypothetical protein
MACWLEIREYAPPSLLLVSLLAFYLIYPSCDSIRFSIPSSRVLDSLAHDAACVPASILWIYDSKSWGPLGYALLSLAAGVG